MLIFFILAVLFVCAVLVLSIRPLLILYLTHLTLQRHQPHPKRKCRNWSDCKRDECCIRYSSTKGFCKRRPQKGDRCKPILLPGLRDCPCDQGLTCTRYKTTKWGIKKHRCELLKHDEDEVDQRYV